MTRTVSRSVLICASLSAVLAATDAALRAETYQFAPTAFYQTFSAAHPVALRVKSGDTVTTTTLEDEPGAGSESAGGAGPLTGPFYIEGAEPGDLLVVTLLTLEPSSVTGRSASVMAPGAVPAGSLSRPRRGDTGVVTWAIDKRRGVVRLDLQALMPNVNWRSRFSDPVLELPLQPALGAMGVAPAGDTIGSPASGPFGGLMASKGIAPGARVMLPVLQPGALLFLGHGHARQGDAAAAGDGIETAMDVRFSVEVVKKKEWPHSSVARPSTVVGEFTQGWPRIETDTELMTVGTAASLAEALQHATLELHHWLDDDFGMSEKTVNIFLGQAIEYEIANAIGPQVTVVARVRKAFMPSAAR